MKGLLVSVGAVASYDAIGNVSDLLAPSTQQITFYTPEESVLVNRLTDIIIPTTDTLGALAVGVPLLMDKLYDLWASKESKHQQHVFIEKITGELNKISGGKFITMAAEAQVAAVQVLDTLAFSTDTVRLEAYRTFKKNIAKFYYYSEIGATQELRYLPVPGRWEACIPFEKVGRTWAS